MTHLKPSDLEQKKKRVFVVDKTDHHIQYTLIDWNDVNLCRWSVIVELKVYCWLFNSVIRVLEIAKSDHIIALNLNYIKRWVLSVSSQLNFWERGGVIFCILFALIILSNSFRYGANRIKRVTFSRVKRREEILFCILIVTSIFVAQKNLILRLSFDELTQTEWLSHAFILLRLLLICWSEIAINSVIV